MVFQGFSLCEVTVGRYDKLNDQQEKAQGNDGHQRIGQRLQGRGQPMSCLVSIYDNENAVIGDDAANQNAQDGGDSVDVRLCRRLPSVDQKLHPDMFVLSNEPGSSKQSQEQQTILGALQGTLYRSI